MKEKYNILLSLDGPYENVLKFKPPLAFNQANAELLVTSLSEVLNEVRSFDLKKTSCGIENIFESKCGLENSLNNGPRIIADYN